MTNGQFLTTPAVRKSVPEKLGGRIMTLRLGKLATALLCLGLSVGFATPSYAQRKAPLRGGQAAHRQVARGPTPEEIGYRNQDLLLACAKEIRQNFNWHHLFSPQTPRGTIESGVLDKAGRLSRRSDRENLQNWLDINGPSYRPDTGYSLNIDYCMFRRRLKQLDGAPLRKANPALASRAPTI